MPDDTLKAGEARFPGPSIQDIMQRDGAPIPPKMTLQSYAFLGDEDLPFERYTSPEFFRLEMGRMWNRTWQWACREEHIPEVGDYAVYDIGPYSILVVRAAADSIKAYHNACLHRGTKLRPSATEGSASQFTCPYHGWTWNLDGTLNKIPCQWDFPHVDAEKFGLPEVKVGLWGGFVFINMDLDAKPLLEYLEVLPDHFSNWRLEDRYIALHIQKELPCNWKLALEAFIEAYHVMETHPQLMTLSADANVQYDIFGDNVSRFISAQAVQSPLDEKRIGEQELFAMMVQGRRSMLDDEVATPELLPGETARTAMARVLRQELVGKYGEDWGDISAAELVDAMEYSIFPNFFLFLGATIPLFYRFRPIGMSPDKSLFDFLVFQPVPKDGVRPPPAEPVRIGVDESYGVVPGFSSMMANVYDQDTSNMRAQQEGCYASKKRGATLGNYQEARIRKLHQTLDKYVYAQPDVQK